MKFPLLLFLCTLPVLQIYSQTDEDVISQKGSLAFTTVYQQWSSGGSQMFSEASALLSWYQPLSREASVALRGSFASVSGDGLTALRSLTDAQLNGNYYIESADIVLSLGLNIPSGKKTLTFEEFGTSFLISNSFFRLQVPQFGMGFNASPSIIWAAPISDRFVVGAGAAYQYRGAFEPIVGLGDYDPGDEISFTGGCDVKVNPTSSLSLDAVFSLYGKDQLDKVEIFAPGNKLLLALRYEKLYEFDKLSLNVIARVRSEAEAKIAGVFLPTSERVEPNQFEIGAAYAARFSDRFVFRFMVEGRINEETLDPFSDATLGAVGLSPEFNVSDVLFIPVRFRYYFGTVKGSVSLSGIDAGIGVSVTY
jgi:hypothetical protein